MGAQHLSSRQQIHVGLEYRSGRLATSEAFSCYQRLGLSEGSLEAAIDRFAAWMEGSRRCLSKAFEFFRPRGPNVQWVKEVWNGYVTPKHAFFL